MLNVKKHVRYAIWLYIRANGNTTHMHEVLGTFLNHSIISIAFRVLILRLAVPRWEPATPSQSSNWLSMRASAQWNRARVQGKAPARSAFAGKVIECVCVCGARARHLHVQPSPPPRRQPRPSPRAPEQSTAVLRYTGALRSGRGDLMQNMDLPAFIWTHAPISQIWHIHAKYDEHPLIPPGVSRGVQYATFCICSSFVL